jgi:hypothetical protein
VFTRRTHASRNTKSRTAHRLEPSTVILVTVLAGCCSCQSLAKAAGRISRLLAVGRPTQSTAISQATYHIAGRAAGHLQAILLASLQAISQDALLARLQRPSRMPFCWPAHGPSRKPPRARGCPRLLVILTSWEWAGARARRNLDLLHSGARPDSQARFL